MVSVTRRVDEVVQPMNGFLDPLAMEHVRYRDNVTLEAESVNPALVGTAVDYLTRMELGDKIGHAFETPLMGAYLGNRYGEASRLLKGIIGIDDESICNAVRLSTFDSYHRACRPMSIDPDELFIDNATCNNIRNMVIRSKNFFGKGVREFGFRFPEAYTDVIDAGDGDYMTHSGLWDMKVSKHSVNSKQTLQILVYYIMGLHSSNPNFYEIEVLGVFNPRLNTADWIRVNDISKTTIKVVEGYVIGYEQTVVSD